MRALGRQPASGRNPDDSSAHDGHGAPFRPAEVHRERRRALMVLPLLLALGACGRRGALFLPEDSADEQDARGGPVPETGA